MNLIQLLKSSFAGPKRTMNIDGEGTAILIDSWKTAPTDHMWSVQTDGQDFEENPLCSCCGSQTKKFLTVETDTGVLGPAVGYCPNDGFVMFTRTKSKKFLKEHFRDSWLANDTERKGTTSIELYGAPELPFSLVHSSLKPRARVLDVGCGAGFRLKAFKEAGYEVEGVELSIAECKRAETILGRKVINASAEEFFSQNNEKFDFIYFFNVVDFLLDPIFVLKSAMKSLSPGGFIFLKVGSLEMRNLYQVAHFLPHGFHFSERSMKLFCESQGATFESVGNGRAVEGFIRMHVNPSGRYQTDSSESVEDSLSQYLIKSFSRADLCEGRRLRSTYSKWKREWRGQVMKTPNHQKVSISPENLDKILPIRFIYSGDEFPVVLK